jgi:hypothetical protein
MSVVLPQFRRFSFAEQPLPVPGDLRISWRLAVILLMLANSRARRASLAKLHVLNYAIRSPHARDRLLRILAGREHALNWQMRVEPAFGRAVDFTVGEKFASWSRVSARTGLELTDSGCGAATMVTETADLLTDEKVFLADVGKGITEQFITGLLSAARDI